MKRVMKLLVLLLLIFKCVYLRSVVFLVNAVNRRDITSLLLEEEQCVSTPSRAE
jgi:hypothetical protein